MSEPDGEGGDAGASHFKTDLAEDRTVLANERTFASWLRTGFGAIGIGLAFNALFGRIQPPSLPKLIATAFLLIAVFIFVAAERRMCTVLHRLEVHSVESLSARRARMISYLATAATVALIAALWLLPIATRT